MIERPTYSPEVGDRIQGPHNSRWATIEKIADGRAVLVGEPYAHWPDWTPRDVLTVAGITAMVTGEMGYRVERKGEIIVRDPVRDFDEEEWIAWFCARYPKEVGA